MKLNLTVTVDKLDFDAEAGELRLSGRNTEENPFVKLGAFHTLDLQLHRTIVVTKLQWDALALARLADAADAAKDADVAVLVLQPGVAHLCLITPSLTLTRAKVIVPIPRKGRRGDGGAQRAYDKFHEALLQVSAAERAQREPARGPRACETRTRAATFRIVTPRGPRLRRARARAPPLPALGQAVLRHVDFSRVSALLVGSPGFGADDFLAYVWAQAAKRDDARALFAHRAKMVRCRASCGFRHAVREVLSDPETAAQLSSTRAAGEVAAFDAFLAMLGRNIDRAIYGYAHVRAACDHGALNTLLLSDSLFRAQSIAVRRQYVALVEDAQQAGAAVSLFSAMHPAGEQLAQLSGVAAVLRFPLADLLLAESAAERAGAADGSTASADLAAGAVDAAMAAGELSSDDDGEGPRVLPGAGILEGDMRFGSDVWAGSDAGPF